MHFCMKLTIPWEWYRTFLAVMKEGSLSGAARRLAITQPTAGRHIAALESALGLVLFTRSQTGLQATDAAVELQGHAQAMENTAMMIERSAASFSAGATGLRGVVRVAASDIIGTEVLPSAIARLKDAYPHLTVELVLSNRVQDLLNREADIAVRMTTPVQEQLLCNSPLVRIMYIMLNRLYRLILFQKSACCEFSGPPFIPLGLSYCVK